MPLLELRDHSIFGNLEDKSPPPTPTTKSVFKAHVLKYESKCFQIFHLKAILKAVHVTFQNIAHDLFWKKHGVVNKSCFSRFFLGVPLPTSWTSST
jgi:hypothetical protein